VPVLPHLVTSPPVPVPSTERKHVAQKPLPVMREFVRIVVPGGLVLDPFAGAGTTGLAALAEGRRFLGIKLHAAYAAIARRRLAAAIRFGRSVSPARHRARDRRGSEQLGTRGAELRGLPNSANSS
jgi:DNA modification methylase